MYRHFNIQQFYVLPIQRIDMLPSTQQKIFNRFLPAVQQTAPLDQSVEISISAPQGLLAVQNHGTEQS
jgi:hypothetical protein